MYDKNILTNIWKYTIFLITNKRVFVAIIAVYYLTIPGVNALGISYILLASNITGFLFEIPSGYLADKIGHKKTLVLSRIFSVISSVFFLAAWNLPSLIVAGIFMSLANAFTSGTGSAFMHESLRSIGRDQEYGKIMGKVKSLGFSIPLFISVSVPFLVAIDIKWPFVVGLVMDLIGLVVSLTLVSPISQKVGIEEVGLKNFKKILTEGNKLGYLKYALYSGVVGGLLFSIGSFRGPYQEAAGVAVMYFGLFFGAGRLFASFLLWNSVHLQRLFTLKKFYFWQTAIYIAIFLVLGLTANPWVVVILFAFQNGIKWGLTELEDSYLLPLIKESRNKATLLSVGAQMEQLIGGLVSPLIGWFIFTYSYQQGMLSFALLLMVITIPLFFFVFKNFKKDFKRSAT